MGKVELTKGKEIYAVTSHVVLLHDSHMYTSLQIVRNHFHGLKLFASRLFLHLARSRKTQTACQL